MHGACAEANRRAATHAATQVLASPTCHPAILPLAHEVRTKHPDWPWKDVAAATKLPDGSTPDPDGLKNQYNKNKAKLEAAAAKAAAAKAKAKAEEEQEESEEASDEEEQP